MARIRTLALPFVASVFLTACVTVNDNSTSVPTCAAGLDRHQVAQLYFGRNIGGTLGVSDADWSAFVDAEITPRFPAGLSIADVSGQWKDAGDGSIVHEPSKAVTIILSGAPEERGKLDAIRAAYVSKFRQDAVMLIQQPACVGF